MKKITVILFTVVLLTIALLYIFIYPKFMIASGYAAKNLCSCVFVAGIDEETAILDELGFNIMGLATTKVDYKNNSVTASMFGMQPKTAYYHNNLGCAIVNKLKLSEVYSYPGKWKTKRYDSLENWFEYIDTIEYLTKAKLANLHNVLGSAFIEKDSLTAKKKTRAVLVLHKGQLVAEQYAKGFDKNSRLMGWSMTKSLTATMLGLLAEEGKLDLSQPTNIKAWQNDDRKNITWVQLLHMNSGLRWKEDDFDDISDVVRMFFKSDGLGKFATQLPKIEEADTHWEYSSGTTNIISTELRTLFPSTEDYLRYPYEQLFYKIGAYSMLVETDATGMFVGSSYSWATARDWAKIGQLYLQKGNWAGEQVLSKQWIDFVQQPAPNSNNRYGGHFWLNKGGFYPDAPRDLYAITGFQGQRVYIIPSKELVIVRLGVTYNRADFNFNEWLANIIKSVE